MTLGSEGRWLCCVALVMMVVLEGCRRRPAKPNPAPAPPEDPPAAVTPTSSAPVEASPSGKTAPAIPPSAQVANPAAIKAAILKYYQTQGRFPNDWDALVKQQYLPVVPRTASGQPVDFREFMRHHSL